MMEASEQEEMSIEDTPESFYKKQTGEIPVKTRQSTGVRLLDQTPLYTSPDGKYYIKPDLSDETYAIINSRTGFLEGKATAYPTALNAVRTLCEYTDKFFKEEPKDAISQKVVSIRTNITEQLQ